MSDKKIDDKILKDIDEAEAVAYKKILGIFDKDNGDFVKIKSEKSVKEIETPKQKSDRKKPSRKTKSEVKDEVDRIILELSEKEIKSMVITIKINGNIEEFVNDEKDGEKYLSKDAQIEKIKETVNGFKNIVIVHSEEELKKLQENFIKKQEKSMDKNDNSKGKNGEVKAKSIKQTKDDPEIKTQIYIRISESDYEAVKSDIENENIKLITNKVTSRDDKSGINMIIKAVDADKVRTILNKNAISVLQDVDGNINWDDIKEKSNKFENVTVEQLRDFQNKNSDKYDYVAFRKEGKYTVFVDKKCDIVIGPSGRKTLKQLDEKVESHRYNNSIKIENKTKNNTKEIKEAVR